MCRVTITKFSNPWCLPSISSSLDPTAGHELLTLYVSILTASLHPRIFLPLWDPFLWTVSKASQVSQTLLPERLVARRQEQWSYHSLSKLCWVLTAHRKQICTWTDSPRSFLETAVVKGYKLPVPRWIKSGYLMETIINNTILLDLKFVKRVDLKCSYHTQKW